MKKKPPSRQVTLSPHAVHELLSMTRLALLDPELGVLLALAVRHYLGPVVMQQLIDALNEAQNGLGWYRGRHPESTDGSDDEAAARIKAAIAKGEALL